MRDRLIFTGQLLVTLSSLHPGGAVLSISPALP